MTHARRYVVSSKLWLTCVSCRVASSKQNVTLLEFPKERARHRLWRPFVQTTPSHCEPTRHSHVCSQHFVSREFVNDVEYQMDYVKKRVISKTVVPTIFPSKVSDSQRSVSGLVGNGAAAGATRRRLVRKREICRVSCS